MPVCRRQLAGANARREIEAGGVFLLCYNRRIVCEPYPLATPWVAPRRLRALWPVVCLCFAAIEATAQTASVLAVREAIRNGADHRPVHLVEIVVVTGIMTDAPHDVGSGNSLANLQDGTGGMALFGDQAVLPPGSLRRGDVVEARGKLAQYRGMEELQIEAVRRTGAGVEPKALAVSAARLRGEEHSGKLVRTKGEIVLLPNGGIALRDDSGEIPVYLLRSFFQSTSFMKRLLQGGQVEIAGFARQRVNDGESADSGYLLSPRDELDFKFAPLTHYREVAAVGLVVLGCFFYLWMRRLAAERRERALKVLSEGWKESDERFRQMAANVGEVFWLLDVERHRLLYVSPAFDRIWGRDPTMLDERDNILETAHPEDRDKIREFLSRNVRQACEETYRIIRPDGTVRWIHDRSFPILSQDGKPYRVAGIAADITERRELEEQLRQAQKMDAVGRLAGGIAHDFNNLLTVIGGYSRTLLDGTAIDDPKRFQLEQVLQASNRAAALTSQLLAFSRKQVPQPRLIDLNHLVANVESLLRRVMGEHIAFHAAFADSSLYVKADPNQLEQVLINLAANARDAMPQGGEFRIETALVEVREGGGEARLETGAYACLKISDSGIGMNDSVLAHAFEPFFTTKGVGKGTGLGLSTAYGLIQQNEGSIHVSSESGRGTTFEIYIPSVTGAVEAGESEVISGPGPGRETIMVAEDEPGVRKLVCDTLEQIGYTILPAADGYEAMRILAQHGDVVDLLLTDVVMPLMGGRELAKRVQSLKPATKVIYMSGYTDDALAFHGFPQSHDGFIQKPFTMTGLAEKIRQVLSEE
jgi:PAS domain S-box-containing protein